MFNERLFYYIHGIVTMFFIMTGVSYISKKPLSRMQRLTGCVILYWGFLEIKDLIFYAEPTIRDNYVSNLLILVDMTAIPAGCFFVFELLSEGWCTLRRATLLALPFIFFTLHYAFTGANYVIDATFIFTWLYCAGFTIYMAILVRRYNRLLAENYSNIELVPVQWLKVVAVVLAVCLAVWTTSCYFSSWLWDSVYQLTLMTLWIVALSYATRRQIPPPNEEKPLSDSILNDNLQQTLQKIMTEDRIWLRPHLTLADLALQVGTNRTYLSNYLNKTHSTTFYDYINSYRLEAALEQLKDPNNSATLIEIAESCGFNSLSTFRRVFQRAKGCSFTEYRRKNFSNNPH
ncbi:MAG: helix-turn-helix transcriptional regulator [Bacteroidales bacterium]|nr:helix-turn-helix transcriptional regulator [Bacteroidales bacterium]